MALQSNPEDQATVPLSDSLSSAEYLQHAVLRMNENDPFTYGQEMSQFDLWLMARAT